LRRRGQLRILAILTVKNEGSFLLEWLAHHRAAGVTDILAFSNDCSDGTDAMLDRLQAMGWLTHVRNDGPHPEGPQWAALRAADRHPLRKAADWILVLDIDEFVNVHLGGRTIPALLAALPRADAIALTWRMFGNGGVVALEDRPVTETFVRAAPALLHWPWRAQLVKTLFRAAGPWRKLGVHRPRAPDPAAAAPVWVDGSGRVLGAEWQRDRLISPLGQDNGALVQLNHYPLGSMEGYLVKADRGRANRQSSPADMGYWAERNFAAVEDRTILALPSAALREELMADAELARLHRAAFAWRRAQVARLMADEGGRALFGRLMMTPPARVLSAAAARRIWAPRSGDPETDC
jgi:hypothetical protein